VRAVDVPVLVFARRPRPGVKKRLARTVGPAYACRVYARLLARTLREVGRQGFHSRVLMAAQAGDADWFAARYGRQGWRVRVQSRGALGVRMRRAMARELHRGRPAILIGSDVVDIDGNDIWHAAVLLSEGQQAVLGPVADGGYWLLGLAQPADEVFADLPWSSARVLEQTQRIFAKSGVSPALLPVRHDIDHARDLQFRRLPANASHWRTRRDRP